MTRLTLYTRPECKLCDAAKFVLQRVQADIPFELHEVDISAPGNEALLLRYGEHIPVICCGAEEWFRHRVVETELRAKVIHARDETNDGKEDPLMALLTKPLIVSTPSPLADSGYLRKSDGVPLAYWRDASNIRAVCNVLWVVIILVFVGGFLRGSGPSMSVIMAYTVLMATVSAIWAIGPRQLRNRYRKRLEANDHLICVDCGYVLAGLPERHTCPECGLAYVADEVRTVWMNWLKTGDMRRAKF